MLLRLILLIIFLTAPLLSAIYDTPYHNSKDYHDDIIILKKILNRKPKDLKALKRIITISFMMEKFIDTERYTAIYLNRKRDKKISYIQIITLANLNRYNDAIKNIDTYIRNNNLSKTELKIILKKKKLYEKQQTTSAYPEKFQKLSWGNNKILISILEREKIYFGYNLKLKKYFLKSDSKNIQTPGYLRGLNLNNIIFISLSLDGKEALISIENKTGKLEILYRKFILQNNQWSETIKIKELNPGTNNCYGNITSKFVMFVSDKDSKNGNNIYISLRNNNNEWATPEKIKKINSSFNESSLYLHPDGETFYFSSNGIEGKGGYDIFAGKITFSNRVYSINSITNITNINTFRNEKFPLLISLDDENVFSNFNEANRHYIYSGEINLKPKSIFILDGIILDKESSSSILPQSIKIETGNSKKKYINVNKDGSFSTQLSKKDTNLITINANGYNPYKETINYLQGIIFLKKRFYLQKIKKIIEKKVTVKGKIKTLLLNIKKIGASYQVGKSIDHLLRKEISNIKNISLVSSKNSNTIKCFNKNCAIKHGNRLFCKIAVYGKIIKTEQKYYRPVGDYLLQKKKRALYLLHITAYNLKKNEKILELKKKVYFKNIKKEIKFFTKKFKQQLTNIIP